MEKFRIVEVISNSGHTGRKGHWIIEEKKFFGWKEITQKEGPKNKLVEHESYEDAELYLLNNYTGHGECKVYGNVYTFRHYTYYS